MHWSPLTRKGTEVLNLAGPVQELGHVQISTMCVKQNLLVASGFQGEMVCKIQFPNILHFFGRRSRVTAYWPYLVMYFSGAVQLMSSNYDAVIRVFVCNNFSLIKSFCFPWAVKVWCIFTLSCRCSQSLLFAVKLWFWMVAYFFILLTFSRLHNDKRVPAKESSPVEFCMPSFTGQLIQWMEVQHTSISPDTKTMVVVGDNADGLLSDSQGGKVIATLKGHLDYSFASAWHPDGRVFVTGNQDKTCRLWDIQNLGSSLGVLKGYIGAIHLIHFTSEGCFLAMAEPADFVHVFDTKQDYAKCQEIDLFGELTGISFGPDSESLYVGVVDRTYGSLLEFNWSHPDSYVNCLL
ncbi:unnamed protein product [Sphagnum troendelagicum]|uniref:Uncharacterized protein n=1 Tax=Sphagnum jensenii TaxID=128206 RepID=A0ABP0XL55_9BRYO